jgi:tripeptide aminopeptidase
MIRKARLVKSFTELIRIPGLSRHEGLVAAEVKKRLEGLGASVSFDRDVKKLGFATGNLIARVRGEGERRPLLLNAHLDTVGPADKISFIRTRDLIRSTGKSILGADDRAGVAVILEVLRHLREDKIPHPRLDIVFTVGEEIGLIGAKHLDYSRLRARHALVLDGGNPSEVINRAPQAKRLIFRVIGREAHAGIHPEQGVNAIQVASDAIASMKLGRIDFETTANIGLIEGGRATNIVPPLVEVRGEARSHNTQKLEKQVRHMRYMMQGAVKKHRKKKRGAGALPRVEEDIYLDYPLMRVSEKSDLMQAVRLGAKRAGIRMTVRASGGGSDANIFNANGIQAVIIGVGMEQVHTTKERIRISRLYRSAMLVAETVSAFR